MTKLHLRDEGTIGVPSNASLQAKKSLRQKLMVAASASMMTLAAPLSGLYGGRASAQLALPTGCSDDTALSPINNNNSYVNAGETIECVSNPAGTAIAPIASSADNAVLNIGDGTTNTVVALSGLSRATIDVSTIANVDINVRENVTIDGTTGAGGRGLKVSNYGGGSATTTITSEGTILASDEGIFANQYYAQINITATDVTSTQNSGISVKGLSYSSDITITTTGDVSGRDKGIVVDHEGGGDVEISANNVYAQQDYGIGAETNSNSNALTVTANGLVSGAYGIGLAHGGSNDVTLNLGDNAEIVGRNELGLAVTSTQNAVGISINGTENGSATISGGSYGAFLNAYGDISVQNLAAIAGGSLTGLKANAYGGAITIQNVDSLTSDNAFAIDVDSRLSNMSGGNDISIQNIALPEFDHDDDPGTANISSANGINANSGTGSLSIGFGDLSDGSDDAASALGDIFSDGVGIQAISEGNGIGINLNGRLEATARGIDVANNGTGTTNITATDVTSNQDSAIWVEGASNSSGVEITTTGSVSGDTYGIYVDHDGSGDVEITANNVYAQQDFAIVVYSGYDSASVDLTANGDASGRYGSIAIHKGSGDLTFTLGENGNLTGRDSSGLVLDTTTGEGGITLKGAPTGSGTISGAVYGANLESAREISVEDLVSIAGGSNIGLRAKSFGDDITILNVDSVTSENAYAIDANSRNGALVGGDISIQNVALPKFDHDDDPGTADIASANGIRANSGSGGLSIGFGDLNDDTDDATSALGDIFSDGVGIRAIGQGNGIGINLNGTLEAGTRGIQIDHSGSGEAKLKLGTNGSIYGENGEGALINVTGQGANILVQGSSGTIKGFTYGLNLMSNQGDITVENLTSIIGGNADSISAVSTGGKITIQNIDQVGSVFGAAIDVDTRLADNSGGNDVSIQNVSIDPFDHDGVSGTSDVYSVNGIFVRSGTGAINIGADDSQSGNAIGNIYSLDRGIYARSDGGAVSIRVDGHIVAEGNAVEVNNRGSGASTVDVNTINNSDGNSVRVSTEDYATDITVRATGSLNAFSDGININHRGTGNVLIEAVDITATNETGIDVTATNDMAGAMTVRATGTVTGNVYGVLAYHAGSDDLKIETFNVNSTEGYGIYASRTGGNIDVSSTGQITAQKYGVKIVNYVNSGTIDLEVNAVEGGDNSAILVENRSDSTSTIDVNGFIYDASAEANILTQTTAGALLTLKNGAMIDTYGLGNAIEFTGFNGASPDDVFDMDELAQVIGAILMGGGADTATLGSDNFDVIYGGAGTDTVNLATTDARTFVDTVDPSNKIREFEILGFSGDNITLEGTHSGWDAVNFNLGTTFLDGTLQTPLATINAGATFHARDLARLEGDLINNGTLLIGSSPGVFTVTGDFVQGSSGLLPIEVFSATWDQLVVEGTTTLGGTLRILSGLNDLPNENQFYPFLDAKGGATGDFDTIEDNVPDLDFTVTTDANVFFLEFTPDATKPEPDPEPEPTDPGGDGDTGDTPTPDPEPDPEPLLSAKEIVPSGLSVAMRVNDMFVENLIQRRAVQITPDQWSFWSAGFGGKHDVGVDDGTPGWAGDTSGLALGVERLIDLGGAPVLFGAAGGYTEASITSDASHSDVESYHLGAFANADLGALFLGGSLAYAWQDYGFERAIIGPSSATLAYGETEGTGWALKSEAFYDLLRDGRSFGPVATFGSTITDYDGFEETGAGILNLNWSDETAYQTVIGLGGEGGFEANLNGLMLDTGLRVLYESVGGDRDLQTRAFLDVPGAQFRPQAAGLDAERVAVSFDTKLYLTKGLFAHVRYDTTRGDNLVDHEGWAGFTLRF